jgi:dihydrodipicolinate synthase/N-acetylneuraminate lyase
VDIKPHLVAKLTKHLPNIRYIKEASMDVGRVFDIVEATEGVSVERRRTCSGRLQDPVRTLLCFSGRSVHILPSPCGRGYSTFR